MAAEYRLDFSFGMQDRVCVWSSDEKTKEKFGSHPIKTSDLPISDDIKHTLDDLIDEYQKALDYEMNRNLVWKKEAKYEFYQKALSAYEVLCEELGPAYEVDAYLKEFLV